MSVTRREGVREDRTVATEHPGDGVVAEDRRYQHSEFGGINWGASFFGWLVAIGLAAVLTAMLSAAGAAIAISEIDSGAEAVDSADTVSIAGGIGLLVIALVSYFAGGYVAGRMSRFDGGRQGFGVWMWAIIVTLLLALLGVIAGEEWNVFAGLNLPRIPVDEGDLATGALLVLLGVLVLTLLAAMAGGKAGERYHRRIDAAGERGAVERDRPAVTERTAY